MCRRHGWIPLTAGGTPTQIQVELDLTPVAEPPQLAGGVFAAVSFQLRSGADRESDAFGGYRGGALVLVVTGGIWGYQ
jgi:hypothetical protein